MFLYGINFIWYKQKKNISKALALIQLLENIHHVMPYDNNIK